MRRSTASVCRGKAVPPVAAVLCERARKRLHIAASLLQAQGVRLPRQDDRFEEAVLQLLRSLPEKWQVELREFVDWIEAYDNASEGRQPGTAGLGACREFNFRGEADERAKSRSEDGNAG